MTYERPSIISTEGNEPESDKKGNGRTQKRGPRLFSEDSAVYDWREFVCGWGAAFINISITFPINKLIFRQVRSSFIYHMTSVNFQHNFHI